MKTWFKKGEHWIWFSASTVSISLVLVFGLLAMITYKGLIHFWPHEVYEVSVKQPNGQLETVIGEWQDSKMLVVESDAPEAIHGKIDVPQHLIKTGNRDILGIDFRWVSSLDLQGGFTTLSNNVMVVERFEYGNLYGHAVQFSVDGQDIREPAELLARLNEQVGKSADIRAEIRHIEKIEIGKLNAKIEGLRLEEKIQIADKTLTTDSKALLDSQRAEYEKQFTAYQGQTKVFYDQLKLLGELTLRVSTGKEVVVPVVKMVHAWQPNNMTTTEKVGYFFNAMGNFLWDDPREANTEGGVFPAIIGTVTMVLLMTLFVTPMGVIAAIYMREYAREGTVLRLVRISINNLAGVPSIVFGIFGLGFFVYILGANVDELFYNYALPSPTFGTPGLLWASLTMALLTLPVVIVSTEEGLSRIPRALREGGLALGATKAETIMRLVLPMAMPAIMTGLILAIARAAGEVAPLMLVGVVKLAPELPIDMIAPFVHLDRKFMHLGFHIYDVGFQSPNIEASQPLVYATSLLLVIIIVGLNLGAITIRNRLRERYKALDH
ncbi:phosphate ABC transporter permease PstA [Thiomicrorhabdus aquaedulcis]|uniref:phosphate ABC transporter permease PstA n=1 Tax=Thiomicrorhabdus aquaedulcis TaxID=2211106 RepID=UPI000FDBC5A7|nr:phosphate ABC transporter permease PstA [Thiomicrorhabdus aquaedulcis]